MAVDIAPTSDKPLKDLVGILEYSLGHHLLLYIMTMVLWQWPSSMGNHSLATTLFLCVGVLLYFGFGPLVGIL